MTLPMATTLFSQPDIAPTGRLIDRYGRAITYLRVSVTDRCDFRCTYCMSEHMTFLPKKDVLSFEEIEIIVSAFVRRGVRKVRLTGGEPLVRRDSMDLVQSIGGHIGEGLEELTLTTNGSQLRRHAAGLAAAGVRRINVSLDTLDEKKFAEITRRGRMADVLDGIDAAVDAGLKIKLNMVAMRGVNVVSKLAMRGSSISNRSGRSKPSRAASRCRERTDRRYPASGVADRRKSGQGANVSGTLSQRFGATGRPPDNASQTRER